MSFGDSSIENLDSWLDVAGLMPPMPKDVSKRIFATLGGDSGGAHTFIPSLVTPEDFQNTILPELQKSLPPDLVTFIQNRVLATFSIRKKLRQLESRIVEIVGVGNFSALWLDREAFSADSMEHRALITEAVIHVYSPRALQEIVELLYRHQVPMIPYGEGGGYNMGVTPMAPAVTISPRGIDHISDIRPSRRTPGKFEVSVGAGVPFKDLVAYIAKRGYVLRCDPNTPRAATGGIAATGSNGGRKAFEVILHGRAVTASGTALCFATDDEENSCISREPFLLARKFFSIDDVSSFQKRFQEIESRRLKACVTPNAQALRVPLSGMKAAANELAQNADVGNKQFANPDEMAGAPTLPISAFVGAEGSTGFIYEVTFEVEKPLAFLKGARWHFSSVEASMQATRAVKLLPAEEQPTYFEILSGNSIRRYLLQDFPSIFLADDEAVLILAVEGSTAEFCEQAFKNVETVATKALLEGGFANALTRKEVTPTLEQALGIAEFEHMRLPREALPKKLRTKCKTDMEIRTEYLGQVLQIVESSMPRARAEQKQDVLFGHLTPNHTAIIHWNIGGFDLYDEEQADIAWDYLENVIGKAQSLAPVGDPYGSARFTGEHGVAGKAPFLWLNYIPQKDFDRMCKVKDILDPKDLFNPDTLFLRTSHVRSLRARLMQVSSQEIALALKNLKAKESTLVSGGGAFATALTTLPADQFAIAEGQKCTRCNSCKICPVIDAEHELEREGKRKSTTSVLPSKRNILMFMERLAMARMGTLATGNEKSLSRVQALTSQMLAESAHLLKKCFYCRRCDKACPVNIEIHPLMRAYHAMGKMPSMGSKLWGFLYERLMGEDGFKSATYKVLAFFMMLAGPFLALVRKLSFLPDWLKTYTVPPTLAMAHYEPAMAGVKFQASDNFVVINAAGRAKDVSDTIGHATAEPTQFYIRYRGCMDTFGNVRATSSVDDYFKEVLGARIIDLEKKMCCGFPFEADGLHERAKQSQLMSMIEIAKCIARLREEQKKAGSLETMKFVVFSNCPTCCEALRETGALLLDPIKREIIRARAGIAADFDMELLKFDVQDTAEIAMRLLKKTVPSEVEPAKASLIRSDKTVGLKVPCHNSKAATAAQMELLGMYYAGVSAYDNCCGLSGTGRLKHPKIGTKISEKLFDQIRESPAAAVVSGCPSCRDGVKMQKDILAAKKDEIAKFEVSGIFEQILKDCQKGVQVS
jgi:FAD/FMN-containing dehydrogenase/Fe-S oxidoreductase